MVTLGILTNGGDGPGSNAAIKYVTNTSLEEGVADNIVGIKHGWMGIYDEKIIPLDELVVREHEHESGTFLGTSRANPFNIEGKDKSGELYAKMSSLGIDALVVIGGEGSLRAAYELYRKKGVPLVGIPQTIDKDVFGTDYTLGFSSAVDMIQWYVNNITPTAKSMNAVHVIKTMGRNAGHLALHGGIAAGVDIILIPEFPFKSEEVADLLRKRREGGFNYDIVLIAENATMYGNPKSESIEHILAEDIRRFTGYKVRTDTTGFIQRGAHTNSYDMEIAELFGNAAVELVKNEKFGYMVGLRNGSVCAIPLEKVTMGINRVDIHGKYDARKLGARNVGLGSRIY